jgi:hypothetical protein
MTGQRDFERWKETGFARLAALLFGWPVSTWSKQGFPH